jgi:hypothetical protein
MQTYKLHTVLTGVTRDSEGNIKVIIIPVGAVIRFAPIAIQVGMVNATWDGKAISVFIQDVVMRAELASSADA